MRHALESLKARQVGSTLAPASLSAMMIQGESRSLWARLYASHPPLEMRIAALREAAL
ncbi:MAG: hypothetical protein HYV15_08335 [Elusimicrobia bacterium]|nr:hypothetical protein [Elusimicrobiota bacterium]